MQQIPLTNVDPGPDQIEPPPSGGKNPAGAEIFTFIIGTLISVGLFALGRRMDKAPKCPCFNCRERRVAVDTATGIFVCAAGHRWRKGQEDIADCTVGQSEQ